MSPFNILPCQQQYNFTLSNARRFLVVNVERPEGQGVKYYISLTLKRRIYYFNILLFLAPDDFTPQCRMSRRERLMKMFLGNKIRKIRGDFRIRSFANINEIITLNPWDSKSMKSRFKIRFVNRDKPIDLQVLHKQDLLLDRT